MLCTNCANLAVLNTHRICLRCNGMIYSNIAVICDNCSNSEKLCAICLKKIYNAANRVRTKSNCSGCGGK